MCSLFAEAEYDLHLFPNFYLSFTEFYNTQVLGVWSTDYIPKGTRFGPLKGDLYDKDELPSKGNRNYLWPIYHSDTKRFKYLDAFDVNKSNWMRFVSGAESVIGQNLVACQVNNQIYFYTVKPIMPDQELLVWYCKEFAERLNYSINGELMEKKIRKLLISNLKSKI